MAFEEKTISSELIYDGKILRLRKDKVTVKTGTSYREIIEHNGAVAVVVLTEDNKVVLVNQYRKACEQNLLEIPAGKLDSKDEVPLDAAVRELKEETGYTADNIRFLTAFYVACGYSQEKISLYLCTGLTKGETDFDDDEDLDIFEMPFEEAYEMCVDGRIIDSKTIIGILMAKELMEK